MTEKEPQTNSEETKKEEIKTETTEVSKIETPLFEFEIKGKKPPVEPSIEVVYDIGQKRTIQDQEKYQKAREDVKKPELATKKEAEFSATETSLVKEEEKKPSIEIAESIGHKRTPEEVQEYKKIKEEVRESEPVKRKREIEEKKAEIEKAKEKAKIELPTSLEIARQRAAEIALEKQEQEAKQYSLKKLLEKEKNLKSAILEIEEKKKRKEDISDTEEDERRKEYKEVADAIKKSAYEIVGKDVEEEAKQVAEKYYTAKNKRRGESVEEMNQRLVEEKAEDKDYQARCIDKIIINSDFSEEQKAILISAREAKFGKNKFSREKAAGFIAGGLDKKGIENIRLPIPIWTIFSNKIKLPDGSTFSEKELPEYIRKNLENNFKEQAEKEIEAKKRKIASQFAYKMYQNAAETGNIKGTTEEAPERPKPEEKKAENPEKPEISEDVKGLMQEKLNEEISRLTAEFYNTYIKGKLKKKGEIFNVAEEEKTYFILNKLKVDAEKNPRAAQLKKELKSLIILREGLKQEKPLLEANYLALNFFYKKTEEISYFKEKPQKIEEHEEWKGEEQKKDWKDYSKITRELANKIAGRNLEEEAKDELVKFLRKPKIKKQFYEEQEKKIKNITDPKQKEFIKKQFKKQFEIRGVRTLEEQKIKKLFKKEKAKEITGEDFSVENSLKKIKESLA